MDSYFWNSLEFEYRRVLLIKPVKVLSDEPGLDSLILKPRVDPARQVNDLRELLNSIGSYKYKLVSKFNRWKTARFYSLILPSSREVRELDWRLNEVVLSEVILRNLSLDDPSFKGIKWLNLRVSGEGLYNEADGKMDNVYTELYKRDTVFSKDLKAAARI